ncbi:MAG: protein translocase subunit SecF [Maricaulaceae bacterium]
MVLALVRYLPKSVGVPFVKFGPLAAGLSALLVIASITLTATLGLNFGIDFRGGTLIEAKTLEGPADLSRVRGLVDGLGLGDVQVQEFGAPDEVLIRVEAQDGEGEAAETAQQGAAQAVQTALRQAYGAGIEIRRVEVVGPKVSGELVRAGGLAVVLALGLMLVYILFRFDWQFSLGAVVALAHDVVLTLGVFALTRLEFNLPTLAAILTIVGYSMNDTVVVYDRVRENLRKYKRTPLREVIDGSLNDTLSRTILTSVTTLLALIALFVLGGAALQGFAFAMIWGVLVGTYSSIYVAAPFLLLTGLKRDGEA